MDPLFAEQFQRIQALYVNGHIAEYDYLQRKKELVDAYVGNPVQKALEASYSMQAQAFGEKNCVRIRGIPFTAGEPEIRDFFKEFQIHHDGGVKLKLGPDGKPSGQAYVKFVSEAEAQRALAKNQAFMGNRYIEVFPCTLAEMNESGPTGPTPWVKLRGLPFTVTASDIRAFFDEFNLGDTQIHLITSAAGKPCGEAFVQFADESEAQRATSKDKQPMGSRYVDVILSTADECTAATARANREAAPGSWEAWTASAGLIGPWPFGPAAWMRNRAKGPTLPSDPVIRVRGLPFRATETEIQEFFKDLEIAPMGIHIVWASGRPTGEAFIEFRTKPHAEEALKLNRRVMGSRYIEIFPATRVEMQSRIQTNSNGEGGGLIAATASAYAPALPDMSYYYGAETTSSTAAF
eukprot:TRINITY_DN17491_c0_g1_i1.p1 TRINITY_DN17491_c0_g1~~TRINITY_DN17491_c0_g1_i1.p1  ORF type:complete len:407 (-),score=50.39 TRINITY_DN17491_c0_g1_i1:54-1274(-)